MKISLRGQIVAFLTVTLIVGALYDIYLIVNKEKPISEEVFSLAQDYPALVFGLGVLFGHFLWPQFICLDAEAGKAVEKN